jgi:dolichyl-phosphate beta-glucosyltransferase
VSDTPAFSVVIPAYNEADRLPRTLERMREYLGGRGIAYEIVVADDGSRDATAERARAAGGAQTLVLTGGPNRGKGHAVRRGMLAARGAQRLMSDADLSTPIEELEHLERRLHEGFDVAIASRAAVGARIEVRQPYLREAAGRFFNGVVRLVAVPGIDDTQCGFKLFTAAAAVACFTPARLDGFSFDVETLFIARKRGLRIAEVPVIWRNDVGTRVSALRGAEAFADLLRIRANDARGFYSATL